MVDATVTLEPGQWAVLADVAAIIQTAAWGGALLAGLGAALLGALFVKAVWVR